MDKKLIILGIVGAIGGYFILSRMGSSSEEGTGSTGGGGVPMAQMPTALEGSVDTPSYNIAFPSNPFPTLNIFELPDPNKYDSGSTKTYTSVKKSSGDISHYTENIGTIKTGGITGFKNVLQQELSLYESKKESNST